MTKEEYENWIKAHVGPVFKQFIEGAITLTEAAMKVCDLVVEGPEPPDELLTA